MVIGLTVAFPVGACSVPVFRYALERWPADRYELAVFHRGPWKPAEAALVERLAKATCNLEVVAIDLNDSPKGLAADLWASQKNAALPWMVLRLPSSARKREIVWAGPLNQANVNQLLDSPLRRRIVQRLLAGESAVWLFVEGGKPAEDAAAFALLEKQLKELQKTLKLPELRENNPEDRIETGPGAPELKVAFSLLRLSRTDPSEALLPRMLLNVEDDLKGVKGPMAFPIFGRGRALYALVDKGINAKTIEEACRFVSGACGCEVKRDNPGMDLLMSAAWERTLESWKQGGESLPPLPRLPAVLPDELPPTEQTAISEPSGALLRNLLIVLGAGLAIAVVVFSQKQRLGSPER